MRWGYRSRICEVVDQQENPSPNPVRFATQTLKSGDNADSRFYHARAAATAWRRAGRTVAVNHGLRRSQPVVRQDGWGSGKWRGSVSWKARTRSVIVVPGAPRPRT